MQICQVLNMFWQIRWANEQVISFIKIDTAQQCNDDTPFLIFLDRRQPTAHSLVYQWQRRQDLAQVWLLHTLHHVPNLRVQVCSFENEIIHWMQNILQVLQTQVAQNCQRSIFQFKGRKWIVVRNDFSFLFI